MTKRTRLAADAIAAVSLVAVFGLLAVGVGVSARVSGWDRAVVRAVVALRDPLLTPVFWIATVVGNADVMSVLTVLVGLAFVAWGKWRSALVFGFAMAGGNLLVDTAKLLAQRVRPPAVDALIAQPGSYSFPSGHAFSGLTFFVLAGLIGASWMRSDRAKALTIGVASLVGLTVGLSRLYLGVHWPSDIVASWAAASAWILLWRALYAHVRDVTAPAWCPPRAASWTVTALLAAAAVAVVVVGAGADPLLG